MSGNSGNGFPGLPVTALYIHICIAQSKTIKSFLSHFLHSVALDFSISIFRFCNDFSQTLCIFLHTIISAFIHLDCAYSDTLKKCNKFRSKGYTVQVSRALSNYCLIASPKAISFSGSKFAPAEKPHCVFFFLLANQLMMRN